MRTLTYLIMLCIGCSCATTPEPEAPLFSYAGKEFQRDDLPETMRQKLFNAQVQYYQDAVKIVRESVIDIYLTEVAKEQGKSLDAVKSEVFSSHEPTEEDKKKFYEEIKDKLPYSYEIIKHELGSLIVEKRVQTQEQNLIAEIEKKKNVKVFLKAPKPPHVDLATKQYPRKGPEKAKVQLVEFGDFSCPNCRLAVDAVEKLLAKYKDKIEFTWRYYFIHSGGASVRLAKGGHCAHQQDKFWQYYDYVFMNQTKLRWKSPTSFTAEISGLDAKEFTDCYENPKTEEFVSKSHQEGTDLGVEVTPTFFVNGKRIVFGSGFQGLEKAIEEAL